MLAVPMGFLLFIIQCAATATVYGHSSSDRALGHSAISPLTCRYPLAQWPPESQTDQDLSNGYSTSASGPAKPPYSAARRAQQAPLAMRGVVLAAALAAVFAGVRAETAIELNGSNGYIAMDDLVRR